MKLKSQCIKHIQQWMVGLFVVCLSSISIHAASYLMITDLGSSAEMIRRGNIEGFSVGSNAIFENPASLHKVNLLSTSVFSSQIMNEVSYRNVSLAFNSDIGVFGFGYMDAGVDDIIKTKLSGTGENAIVIADGVFSYKNRVIKVGYQNSITETLHIGVNAVGYMNEIHTYKGSGYNLDVGAMYSFSELDVSLFARNLIPTKIEYSDSEDDSYKGEESLPLQVIFSAAYPFGDLDILGQLKFDGVNSLMSGGLDYTPSFLFNMLTLSAGYKEFSVLDNISNTITLGVGLNLWGLSLDYAYEKSDHFEYDANNFASVGFDF
tara:strand:+ start:11270 stop:12229 length:960 start_codon:yes stop_codon:yes gene_type:complete